MNHVDAGHHLLSAAQEAFNIRATSSAANPADPYMTALCYFNALRELGGARRIVEDEVLDRTARAATNGFRSGSRSRQFSELSVSPRARLTRRRPM
jgi:hypothetical protein